MMLLVTVVFVGECTSIDIAGLLIPVIYMIYSSDDDLDVGETCIGYSDSLARIYCRNLALSSS